MFARRGGRCDFGPRGFVSRGGVRCALVLFVASSLGGCGGALYAVKAGQAESSLREAEAAGAVLRAPYDYYLSVEHLRKARAEASDADFGDAIALAEAAREFALRSLKASHALGASAGAGALPSVALQSSEGVVAVATERRIASERARLEQVAASAEQAGARSCAARELAAARSQLQFAALEDAQGSRTRAEQHLRLAEQNVQAARMLAAPAQCAAAH